MAKRQSRRARPAETSSGGEQGSAPRGRRRHERDAGGGPTPEQLARNVYGRAQIKEPGRAEVREAVRNLTGSQVDRWHNRGLITEVQFDVVDRYRTLFERAGLTPRITSRYGPQAGGGGGEAVYPCTMPQTLAQLDARTALRLARAAMPQTLAARFEDIVCHELGAGVVAGGEPNRAASARAIEWVRICANELAGYWKISS